MYLLSLVSHIRICHGIEAHILTTPSGVSIHLIDEGVDTGAIIYQRYVNFDKEEDTFSKTYKKLIVEIEKLFRDNIDELISKKFIATPQRRKGSYHSVANLPKEFIGWAQ